MTKECPTCGSALIPVGANRVCLDCAYQEEILPDPPPVIAPPSVADHEGRANPSDAAGSGKSPAEGASPFSNGAAEPLWLPPRRLRGGMSTPLGFQSGHPCPRICGGTLKEKDGILSCTICDFRYVKGGADQQDIGVISGEIIESLSPPVEPPNPVSPLEVPPSSSDTPQTEKLQEEIARLKEENFRLMGLLTHLLQTQPLPPSDSAPPVIAAPPESPSAMEAERQAKRGRVSWWRRKPPPV